MRPDSRLYACRGANGRLGAWRTALVARSHPCGQGARDPVGGLLLCIIMHFKRR